MPKAQPQTQPAASAKQPVGQPDSTAQPVGKADAGVRDIGDDVPAGSFSAVRTTESADRTLTAATAAPSAPQPPNPIHTLLAAPIAVANIITTAATTFLASLFAPGPSTPPPPLMLFAVLGWVQRELQRTFSNQSPTAIADSITTAEDTEVTIPVLANDTDPDTAAGDVLTVTSYSQPANGQVTLNPGGTFTYTPERGFSGVDTFTYTVSDETGPWHLHGQGTGHTSSATVSITVTAVDDAPRVTTSATAPDAVTGNLTVTVVASAADGGAVTIAPPVVTAATLAPVATLTENGVTTATYSFTPGAVARDAAVTTPGVDQLTLTFTATDASGRTATADVLVTVAPTWDDGVLGDPIMLAGRPTYLETTPDGSRVFQFSEVTDPVTGARSTAIQVIDPSTGTEAGAPISLSGQPYSTSLQFSDDGTRAFVTARSYENDVYTSTYAVLDARSGALLGAPVTLSGSYLYPTYNDDETRVYLFGQNGSGATDFVIVDATTGTVVGERLAIAGSAYPGFSDDWTRAVFRGYSSDYDTATITVVDLATGSTVGQPVSLTADGTDAYLEIRSTDDGKRVLLIAREGYYTTVPAKLRIVDVETGTALGDDVVGDTPFQRIDFTADYGRAFLVSTPETGSGDRTFTVLDTATGAVVGEPISLRGNLYYQPAYNADRSRAILVSSDRSEDYTDTTTVTVVDTATGRVLGETATAPGYLSGSAVFNEAGTRAFVVTQHYANTTSVTSLTTVDVETGDPVGQRVDVDSGNYSDLRVVGGYAYLVTNRGYSDTAHATLVIVDAETGNQVGQPTALDGYYSGYDGAIRFIGNRGYFTARSYTQNYDYTTSVVVIDTDNGVVLGDPTVVNGYLPAEFDFSADGKRLFLRGRNAYGSVTNQLRIVDVETGARIGDATLAGKTFSYLSRNDDATRVYLTSSSSGTSPSATFTVLNAVDGSVVGTPIEIAGDYVTTQQDGMSRAYLIMNAYDQPNAQWDTTIGVIDTDTGTLVNTPLSIDGSYSSYYTGLRFNGDGSRVVYSTATYEIDPATQTPVSVRQVGLIDGLHGTLLGAPATISGDDNYYYADFNDEAGRVHVTATDQVTIYGPNWSSSFSRAAGIATFDSETGALIGPVIDLDLDQQDANVEFNDDGTLAFVTIGDRQAHTASFVAYNIDTGTAGTSFTAPAEYGYFDTQTWLTDRSRLILVAVSPATDGTRQATAAIIDTGTGEVLGAPVVLSGTPEYRSPRLSDDESQLILTATDHTSSEYVYRQVVIDTLTGDSAVTNTTSNTYRSPTGHTIEVSTRGDSDPSTLETLFTVDGSMNPVVIKGYWSGSPIYSADGGTLHVFTVDGTYYSDESADPADSRTRYVAIDLATATALGDGVVEVGGGPVYNYWGGGGPGGEDGLSGNLIMRTAQYGPDGTVTATRMIFLDRTTGQLSFVETDGAPQSGYSLRTLWPSTNAIQSTLVISPSGPITHLTVVDLATGSVVGTPIVLTGTETDWAYGYQSTRYLTFISSTADDGTTTTLFHTVDSTTSTLVGNPVTMTGTPYSFTYNTDRTKFYMTTEVVNADGTSTYLFHVVPVGDSDAGEDELVA
ncbi:cadherin-like domain-containing protein [Mycolicibacterium arenosum]|uniref:Cadherin-like domain-containing protein n=1 Tax=Mycolicibacterium arenosum TaxID=2952157 RepID=A0ABT1M331_9MYCO|nr:cadherin-like domain-containing protein [Mycolicibacterium sp. CAU 1645]MCP9273566.1 cadherin-like domain-containing protein [Mycolicibacterium sp. CAU 1645]